jgi:lysophospholipase L1-like esterase
MAIWRWVRVNANGHPGRYLVMRIHARLALAASTVLIAWGCVSCTSSHSSGAGETAQSASASASESASVPTDGPLSLVVIGDSIPYNASYDCPGCVGFVAQYALALGQTTGRTVETTNLSEHNNLTLPMLLKELHAHTSDEGLPSLKEQLSSADAIIVGIAHNSIELNADRPCGTRFVEARNTFADWSKLDAQCARRTTALYRPQYDKLYSTIASWRGDKPTILRTIDKYNDWIGWKPAHLTREQVATVVVFHNLWDRMLCASATAHGFTCADIYHAFNGPDGTRASGNLLGLDYTHPSQKGNDLIAKTLIAQGFAPLA